MNSIYQMFNDSYIQEQAKKAHEEQVENVQKSIHKLHDFLDSLDDIKPEYRQGASQAFCVLLLDFIKKHSDA